jgi:hypothetical protein
MNCIQRLSKGLFLCFTLVLLHLTPAGAQNLIVNGGFDTGNFSGWTTLGQTTIGSEPQSGSNNARLGAATLSQTFATIPGQTYLISYFIGHTGTNFLGIHGLAVNFNSVPPGLPTVLQAANLQGNVPYGQQNFSVVATAATSILRFTTVGAGAGRYILDSVSVVQQVPELNANAALVPLCLLTMFGLLVSDRRRQLI